MTPLDTLTAVACYAGAAVLVVFTLVLIGCFVFAAFVFCGWMADHFKTTGTPGTTDFTYPDGTPGKEVRFPTGQVGTAPAASVPKADPNSFVVQR